MGRRGHRGRCGADGIPVAQAGAGTPELADVVDAAQRGDTAAEAIVERLAERLARVSAVLAGLLDVEQIIVCGGAADAQLLGPDGRTEIVEAALELLHRRAAEERMAGSVDDFYGTSDPPLPVGVRSAPATDRPDAAP